jgi:hypothetical protein
MKVQHQQRKVSEGAMHWSCRISRMISFPAVSRVGLHLMRLTQ